MRFKLLFPPELKADVEETLADEKKRFDKGSRSKAMKPLNRIFGSVVGIAKGTELDIFSFSYVMHDTDAEIILSTPVDSMIRPTWMLNRLKEFEKADPRIKIQVVVEEEKTNV